MDYVTLRNGVQMPQEGFGVFQIRDLDECERVVLDAIGAGYRLIDTAESYGNESAVGKTVDELPAVNQVELHPFFQQENALSLMREYGVQPMAWAPFAEGKHGIFTHPVLTKIGEKYGKGAGQVALRWNMQRGVVVIPKSTHRERMEQNIDVFDFSLTDEEMAEIAALDIGHSEIIDHTDPRLVQALHGRKL